MFSSHIDWFVFLNVVYKNSKTSYTKVGFLKNANLNVKSAQLSEGLQTFRRQGKQKYK